MPVVGAPVFLIIQGPELGSTHPALIGAATLAAASWIGFVWRERRARNPLAPLALFTNRTFTVLNLVTFVQYAALISCGVYTVLLLQQTAWYAPAVAGLVAVIPVAVLFVFAKPAAAVAQRYSSRPFISVGALLVGIAVLLLLRA